MDGCALKEQGLDPGACLTRTREGRLLPACQVTLRLGDKGELERLIHAVQLSRPEDYLSVYQSGCNHSCLKCHSASFSKEASGQWISTSQLARAARDYSRIVTVWEPRSRATMWHASTLCVHCGSCLTLGQRSSRCPRQLQPKQVTLSVQGFGPARNIIAFTGGDLACHPEYYAQAATRIKEEAGSNLWVLLETNGYALTPANLETMRQGGVDALWLDIKAYDPKTYRKLCGTDNRTVLEAVPKSLDAGFTLEVLTLYIPGWVETDQHAAIARHIASYDPHIPTTLLAFFPAHKLSRTRPPTLQEMVRSCRAMQEAGLTHLRLGNLGVFAKTSQDLETLTDQLPGVAIG